mmetsp:Transcript_3795/g.10112  ORF Transcript_3795/g.10112 Transcript_3795/m.10112 type:complete len:138 (-) Transcript_3795:963-1376(-)
MIDLTWKYGLSSMSSAESSPCICAIATLRLDPKKEDVRQSEDALPGNEPNLRRTACDNSDHVMLAADRIVVKLNEVPLLRNVLGAFWRLANPSCEGAVQAMRTGRMTGGSRCADGKNERTSLRRIRRYSEDDRVFTA